MVGVSFVLLGMALICGLLVRKAVPWLAAVYIPTSVIAGFRRLLPSASSRSAAWS